MLAPLKLDSPDARLQTAGGDATSPAIELSVVMPCLNEADSLESCIRKARQALQDHDIQGDIIVADNGSTDGSQAIAARLGARVVGVAEKGYGSALMGGIAAAPGKFILMGDADDSYDFRELPKFVDKLREGYDLVQGCRLPAGGGRVMPGAMPFLHRWLGNPLFSFLVRHMFWSDIHDVYCGMRGFTKQHYDRLDPRCTGMEFATEMILKSSLARAKIAEVPITLYPDGRKSHPPHLRTFRDGWRTLRFLLIYSPRWLFVYPGITLILWGLLGYGLALPGVTFGGVTFDAHTLLFASLSIILGFESIVFGVFTKTFAIAEGLLPEDRGMHWLYRMVPLERGLLLGTGTLAIGLALLVGAVNEWRLHEFGPLNYAETMRWVIPGATLTMLGFQTILASFFGSILGCAPMKPSLSSVGAAFDAYAADYDAALAQGIAVSGEDKEYFAQRRVAWLAKTLGRLGERPRSVLDFGCGTGSASPYLLDVTGVQSVVGVDISSKLLEVARRAHGSALTRFIRLDRFEPACPLDLAFCNGVFHHIPPKDRAASVQYVYRRLRPGGLFALWENNPWNPGTRLVMSRIPFDRDAIPLSPPETKRLLRAGGFEIIRTDFLFIFPRMLHWFRGMEPFVSRLPLGAQYQVLARKLPGNDS